MNCLRPRAIAFAALLVAAGMAGAAPSAPEPSVCTNAAAMPAAGEAAAAPMVPMAPMTGEIAWIGPQSLEYWVHRASKPRATLVFENGLMLPLTTWQKVAEALAGEADILLYNRPGVGRSTAPEPPRDPTSAARLLHELLRAQELRAPYIVVGHSLGGQYAQLFARVYRQEVSAMLLVDALPPGALKPDEEFPWYTQLGLRLLAPAYARREIADAHAIGELLLSGPGSFDKPVIRLIAIPDPAAGKPEGLLKDLAKGVIYAEDFGVWAVDPDIAEQRLDQLYPRSVVRQFPARHRMQEDTPGVVVEALRELFASTACPPS